MQDHKSISKDTYFVLLCTYIEKQYRFVTTLLKKCYSNLVKYLKKTQTIVQLKLIG